MLHTLAVAGYRSLREVVVPLGQLTLITGANGSGKSSLYRAVRLLAEMSTGGAIASLATEGGLRSVLWAGPEELARSVRRGDYAVEGTVRKDRVRVRLGFAGDDLSYSVELGMPVPVEIDEKSSAFNQDPEVKAEHIWHGPVYRASTALTERKALLVRNRDDKNKWQIASERVPPYASMFTELADPSRAPEVLALRESIRSWRFYDHFRTDPQAPARQMQVGTRTPVLSADGHDLAAALQTIREIGDSEALDAAIADAFDGARVDIARHPDGRFSVELYQRGLLRVLSQAELSDGTLRYLLLVAALLTPRPPTLMVLNEPETSLHPDLVAPLARLITQASKASQLWIVSHSPRLTEALRNTPGCVSVVLKKDLGETNIEGQTLLERSGWAWPPS